MNDQNDCIAGGMGGQFRFISCFIFIRLATVVIMKIVLLFIHSIAKLRSSLIKLALLSINLTGHQATHVRLIKLAWSY